MPIDPVSLGLGLGGIGMGIVSNIFRGRHQNKLNKIQMQREDNAVQRRAADLEAAGLSKTLAAGSPAGTVPGHQAQMGSPMEKAMAAMNLRQAEADYSATRAGIETAKAQAENYRAHTIEHRANATRAFEQAQNYRLQNDVFEVLHSDTLASTQSRRDLELAQMENYQTQRDRSIYELSEERRTQDMRDISVNSGGSDRNSGLGRLIGFFRTRSGADNNHVRQVQSLYYEGLERTRHTGEDLVDWMISEARRRRMPLNFQNWLQDFSDMESRTRR